MLGGGDGKSKTRLAGDTHWRSTCTELATLRQIVEKSPAFANSRNAFRDVKRRLRVLNALPPPLFTPSSNSDFLVQLLPERRLCEHWTSLYFETYGRLFDFIHPIAIRRITENIWRNSSTVQPSSMTLVLLIVALATQTDEDNRLLGRRVAQQLQDFLHSSGVLHKPSTEVFQNLCLLVLLQYIVASDTDKYDCMSSVLGVAQQMAFAMGLHRDPSLLPTIDPYKAELRNRLWSNFFRLALEYSVQTGYPLVIRAEDSDCAFPINVGWDEIKDGMTSFPAPKDQSVMTESTFGIVMSKLATLAASTQQDICSPVSKVSAESCKELRKRSRQILASMPKCLQHGTPNTDGINRLRQGLIAILEHRSSLLLCSHFLLRDSTPGPHQKTLLFDIWDSSCSILRSVQTISKDADTWNIGRQLVWADACRATFCASMVLPKLRNLNALSSNPSISPISHHTIISLQHTLNESLASVSDLWLQKVQFGPTVAKAYFYMNTLANLSKFALNTDQDVTYTDGTLAGVKAANDSVGKIRRIAVDLQSAQQTQHQNPSISMLTPLEDGNSHPASAAMPLSHSDYQQLVSPTCYIPDLPTAGCMNSLGTNLELEDWQFGRTVPYDNSSRLSQQHFFDGTSVDASVPPPLPHLPDSFHFTTQNNDMEDMTRPSDGTTPGLDVLPDDHMLMRWLDDDGTMNAMPIGFELN